MRAPTSQLNSDQPRPMTSVRAAGYQSQARGPKPVFDPLQQAGAFSFSAFSFYYLFVVFYSGLLIWSFFFRLETIAAGLRGPAPPLQKRSESGPEYKAKEMEKEVNALIEQSAQAAALGDSSTALTKAKEAAKYEQQARSLFSSSIIVSETVCLLGLSTFFSALCLKLSFLPFHFLSLTTQSNRN